MKGLLGDPIAAGSVGSRQVGQNPSTVQTQPPIPINRFCRNGKHPNATLVARMGEAANMAALYRTKCVFSGSSSMIQTASVGAGSKQNWTFGFHTGPYTTQLMVLVTMAGPSTGFAANTYAQLDIKNAAGSSTVASAQFSYGPSPIGATQAIGWQYTKELQQFLTVSADTDYTGYFYSVDNAVVLSATVFELTSLTGTFNGYLPQNFSAKGSVLDLHRQNLATVLRNLWKRGGAHVLNFSVGHGLTAAAPVATTSATFTNVIDNSSTTVTAATTPGYSLDMRGKNRVSQTTGVPVRVAALINPNDLAAGNGGVQLKNASGTTVALLTNGFIANTPTWYWANAVIPATADKWDLMYKSDGVSNMQLYSVSIMEYDP